MSGPTAKPFRREAGKLGAWAMDATAKTIAGQPGSPWREELRATLALASARLLANLTQHLIPAADNLLLGRLCASPLAAATLCLYTPFTFEPLMSCRSTS